MIDLSALPLNWVDAVLASLFLLCLVFGIVAGFVWQVAKIVSLLVGVLAGIVGGPLVAAALDASWPGWETLFGVVGYMVCFLVAAFVVRVLAKTLAGYLERLGVKWIDRLAGGLLGALKGATLCAVLAVLGGRYGPEAVRDGVDGSFSGEPLLAAADATRAWARDTDVTERARETGRRVIDAAREAAGDAADTDDTDAFPDDAVTSTDTETTDGNDPFARETP